jgi:hypothetical protein
MTKRTLRLPAAMPAVRGLAVAAAILAGGAVALPPTPAAAAGYVGSELGDVKPEDKAVVASPRPVQLIYSFATKGAPNKPATKQTKDQVLATVRASGLFSEISETPTPNGAILSIVVDNVPPDGAMTEAAAKGAVTGATLFVVGSNTRDYYRSTIEYVSGPTAEKVTRTATHSIVFQMGLINSTPDNAVKVDGGLKGSINTMIRQIVSNPLNQVARDPNFAPSAAPAPAPAAAPAEAAPAAPAAPAEPATVPAADAKPTAQ